MQGKARKCEEKQGEASRISRSEEKQGKARKSEGKAR